jgi:hypothetical protein
MLPRDLTSENEAFMHRSQDFWEYVQQTRVFSMKTWSFEAEIQEKGD